MNSSVSIRLLGKPSYLNGVTEEAIANEHPLLLLTYLTAHEAWIERKEILKLLFEEDDERTARNKLRQLLFRAKKNPWFEGFESRPQHLKHGAKTDLRAFRSAIEQGNWADALGHYNGQLLQETPISNLQNYETWLNNEREELRTSYTEAALWQAKTLAEQKQHDAACNTLKKVLHHDKLNEDAMQAYLQSAPQSQNPQEALSLYKSFKSQLERDLNMQPLAETLDLANTLIASINQKTLSEISTPKQKSELKNAPKTLTSFVGRDPELTQLISLLEQEETQLLSLIGIGGIGKTRLSLAVANDYAKTLKDGGLFVPLASTSNPDYLASSILTALELELNAKQDPQVQVIDYLKDKELLLLLDNFEQLMPAVSFIQELLSQAPQLKLLVTSRERLNLSNEQVFELTGMALPESYHQDSSLEAYDGIRLFLRSARKNNPQFTLNDTNQQAIFRLCHTLEGVPLALELAASWLRLMNVAEILEETQKSFDLIESDFSDLPKRHQSLRAVFDSSWNLLNSDEQTTLVELSVFIGGFTLDAARNLSSKGPRSLLKLVNKSLIRRTQTGRFEYLEVIRQYAFEKLLSKPELATEINQKHATYYAQLALDAEPHLKGSAQQLEWLNKLEDDHNNLRKALESLLGFKLEAAFLLANDLFNYWLIRGHWNEAQTYYERLITLSSQAELSALKARSIANTGYLATMQGHYATATELLQKSVALSRELNDASSLAYALLRLGSNAHYQGKYKEALRHLEESLNLAELNLDTHAQASALHELANAKLRLAKLEEAKQAFSEALALRRNLQDFRNSAISLTSLGIIARRQGNYDSAEDFYKESLELARKVNDKVGIANGLNALGVLVKLQGRYPEAKAAYDESIAIYEAIGDKFGVAMILENQGILARLQKDYLAATKYLNSCLENHRNRNDTWGASKALNGLGIVSYHRHDIEASLSYLKEGLPLAQELEEPSLIAQNLIFFSFPLSETKHQKEASLVLAKGKQILKEANMVLVPIEQEQVNEVKAKLEFNLGKESFDTLWLSAQELSLLDIKELMEGISLGSVKTTLKHH